MAGARVSIQELNGMLVDGCHLLVAEAAEKKMSLRRFLKIMYARIVHL